MVALILSIVLMVYRIRYKKDEYSPEDLEKIKRLDKKLDKLIDYIQNELTTRILVFCARIDTRDYLKKVLKCLEIETVVLVASDDERKIKIEKFNIHDGDKALVSTWQIGNVGINLHGADTVICYEPNADIDKLEQGLGRIDRIGLGYDDINMVYLKPDENSSRYDNYKINIIFNRLFNEQLPNIPSKNLLFSTSYLSEHIAVTKKKCDIYSKLSETMKDLEVHQEISEDGLSSMCTQEDFILVRDELFIEKVSCSRTNVVSKANEYEITNNNIQHFLKMAATNKNKNRLPEEILKEAIYYYDKKQLKVISIQELIQKVKDFVVPSEELFNEGMDFWKDNAAEIIKDHIIIEKIEKRYHPLFTEGIKSKKVNVPIGVIDQLEIVK